MQRPLTGEPLALDLVNTQWIDRGHAFDLFDELGTMRSWLHEHRLVPEQGEVTPQVETALRTARSALRAALERDDEQAEVELNLVLARGALRRQVRSRTVVDEVDVQQDWLPAWRAASSYAELLEDRPDRIRRCAHPACVLYFYDTSRNGTRRWCSMEGCGSRAKSSRYYSRARGNLTRSE